MYRYLEKYTGTYRVLAEYDINTGDFPRDENGSIDESFEDLYIPCARGKSVIKHTYEDNILCICFYDKAALADKVYAEIKNKYKNIWLKKEIIGIDGMILFEAEDIKKIATIIKPRTSGASIKWYSTRNLPKNSYAIPEDKENELKSITKNKDKTAKMQFGRKLNSEFLISNNLKEKQKESRLSPKEFIFKEGLWDEYIKFGKKLIKEF